MAEGLITSAILHRGAREGIAQLLPAAGMGRLVHTVRPVLRPISLACSCYICSCIIPSRP